MGVAALGPQRLRLRPSALHLESRGAVEPAFSLSFPGCGVMLNWQLGVLKGLSRHVDPMEVPLLGSSSGALTAALGGCGVGPEAAAEELLRLMCEQRVAQRRLGLIGRLGSLTRTWLDRVLPDNAGALLSRGRTTVLVTQLPRLQTQHISAFGDKQDVVEVVMASAHLPLVLDGSWYATCRSAPAIDGGLWWWWRRCEAAYTVPAGRGGSSSSSGSSGSSGSGSSGSSSYSRTSAEGLQEQGEEGEEGWVRASGGLASGGAGAAAAAAAVAGDGGGGGSSGAVGVALSSPTSFLDFIAGDVQRGLAPEVARQQRQRAAAAAAHSWSFSSAGGLVRGSSSGSSNYGIGSSSGSSNYGIGSSSIGGGGGGGGGFLGEDASTLPWAAAVGGAGSPLPAHSHTFPLLPRLHPHPHPHPHHTAHTHHHPHHPHHPHGAMGLALAAAGPGGGVAAAASGNGAGSGGRMSATLAAQQQQWHMQDLAWEPYGGGSSSSSSGGSSSSSSSRQPVVLIVQPGDDPAVVAEWGRFRNWRPSSPSSSPTRSTRSTHSGPGSGSGSYADARELLRRGEAYGAGPLLRRIEAGLKEAAAAAAAAN
ncbi:hypothetical protein CHLRE_26g756847v5 [Chlamydomonas reinhardtii]|uniref:Patatin n=1 Tax=Chlamydomonas reinhardtii TaxID=3055 RepID=A0A2K3CN09_CHLRE|nr:uncharacterized protein CHLRE_26g756847v5 [Chlamydomonas reinhardtii]PNW69670.1 hypothetical protein CHLRE_26g756847v5 [Chlamydomonas reinhardtii]